jgi:hypothetical protein
MNRRKVAIVVRGATHKVAPWHDPEWEIWGVPWITYPRVTRFFEIHEETYYTGPDAERDGNVALNAERWPGIPVFCTKSRAHAFKEPVHYPFREILDCLPIPFLEDSVAHMIALAIHEGVDELGLYGVHMMPEGRATMGAYFFHRASVTYLVGLAQGRGIKVTVAPGSPLFMSLYVQGRYGITDERRY